MIVTVELPMPPTTNHLFVNAWGNRKGCTQEYQAWKTEAGWILQGYHLEPRTRPVRLGMVIHGGKGFTRGCDLTNRWKALEDLLVSHGILKDDNVQYVVGHTDDYVAPTTKGQQARCIVTIKEIEGRQEMKQITEEIAMLADQSADALKNGEYEKASELMSQIIVLQKQMNKELKIEGERETR